MKARRELSLRESLFLSSGRESHWEKKIVWLRWPNYVGLLNTCEVNLGGETQWPLKTISGLRISRAQACRQNKGVPPLINSFLCGPAPTDPRTGPGVGDLWSITLQHVESLPDIFDVNFSFRHYLLAILTTLQLCQYCCSFMVIKKVLESMKICKHSNKLVAETSHLPLAFHIPHCVWLVRNIENWMSKWIALQLSFFW